MQNRGRRPPINLDDLQGGPQEEEGPGRGSLSYAQAQAPQPPRKAGGRLSQNTQGGTMNFASLLLSVVAAAAISFLLVNQMAASKADLDKFKTDISAQVSTAVAPATTGLAQANTRIDNVIASTSGYVKSEALSSYALKTDIVSGANYYTKAEIDDFLKKKANVGSTTTPTSPSTPTSVSGGYTVTVDKTQVISMATDTGNKDVTLTVVNGSGVGGSPALVINLTPVSPSAYDTAKITTYTAYSTLSGWTAATSASKQNMSDVPTLVQKLFWIAPSFYLDNGASKTIWMHFDVKTVDVVTWNLTVQVLN